MSSPFSFASNATLIFSVPTNSVTADEWGNITNETTTISITCLLKPSTPKAESMEGIDQNSTYLEGFLVEPLELPVLIKPLTKAIAVIVTANGVEETGEFTLLKTIQNPFVMSANVDLVNRIRGFFLAKNV
jgi:hypothetical protein